MFKDKSFLAIIPARSGSKRLKNKNIRLFCGKPLISYSIKESKKSYFIDKAIVSTDSLQIANLSKKFGIEVPFLRPKNLSKDNASSESVIEHSLKYFIKKKIFFDYFVLLQPTSPIRFFKDIDNAIKKIVNTGSETLISVTNKKSGKIIYYDQQKNLFKRIAQEKKSLIQYNENGSIYICKTNIFLKSKILIGNKKSIPFIMPNYKYFDIDNISDFKSAEKKYQSTRKK
ncbi:acylneuraminate cytidylyltransferase family protein [Pelagibacteraceae bacterium]|nr:acylneuraminate cytidylyltransferase family protein [Pelagibacteraceae bacterium]